MLDGEAMKRMREVRRTAVFDSPLVRRAGRMRGPRHGCDGRMMERQRLESLG